MKVLVVEDELTVAQSLEFLLSEVSYAVDVTTDGESGLELTEAFDYDLVLLDMMLPGIDGISLCQRLRSQGKQMPILLLTGESDPQQKVIALNAGADDYVVKPFNSDELLARLQALLRRGNVTTSPILTWGKLSLNPSSQQVAYGSTAIAATPKEYAILELFLRHPQRAMNAAAIIDHAWNSVESPGEEAVRVHIKELRKKLVAAGAPQDFIKTVHRVGYQLNLIYGEASLEQTEQLSEKPAAMKMAELKSTNQDLREVLEQLRATQMELVRKNEELEIANQLIKEERQRLQEAQEELEQRVADRTTELTQANAILTQQASRLRRLTANVAVVIYQYVVYADGSDALTYVNPKSREVFGLEPEEMMGDVKRVWGTLYPEDAERLCQAIQQSAERMECYDVELRLLSDSDRPIWIRAIAQPERQPNGDIIWDGLVQDITTQKQVELSLQQSEAKNRAILSTIPDLMLRVAADGTYREVVSTNCNFEVISVDCIGQSMFDVLPLEIADQAYYHLQQALQTGEPQRFEQQLEFADRIQYEEVRVIKSGEDEALFIIRDITDRKQTETAIQSSEAMLMLALEGAQAGIGHWDLTTGQLTGSAELYHLYGLDPTGPTPTYNEWWNNLLHPDDREWVDAFVKGLLTQKRTEFQFECRILHPQKGIRWMLIWGRVIYDPQGNPVQLSGINLDTTERNQLVIALRESETKLRQVLDSAIASIVSFKFFANHTWEYDYWSAGCEAIFGYAAEEFMADPNLWRSRIVQEDWDTAFSSMFQDIEVERSGRIEYRFRHKDDSIHWISSHYTSQQTAPDCWNVTVVDHDITHRKHLENSLRTSEAKLARIFDKAVAAIGEFSVYPDRTFQHKFLSAGAEAVYGCSPDEMTANPDLWASRVVPEDMEMVIQGAFERIFAEHTFTIEYRFLDQAGQLRWIAETLVSRWDEARSCWIVTTVATNITERKEAERTLQKQIRQEYLLADIAQDIRQSLQLDEVLARTVHRVREFLDCDRVIIFRFRPDWQGDVIMESVGSGYLPILDTTISDPCFEEHFIEPYRHGHVSVLEDIAQPDLEPCYVELLQQFGVKANLAVPILQGEALWGLLLAHQCYAPRQWKSFEIALLRRLATQVGIAIQQSELYEQTRYELKLREQMQAVLEASEERFRTLSASAPVGILQSTPDGICIYCNPHWQQLTGLGEEDALGLGWQQAIHPEDRDRIAQAWEQFLQKRGECCAEFRLLTSQGEVHWVSARATAIQSSTGAIIGNVCIYVDITQQKQDTAKIQEQAALLDIASDAIFVRDLHHKILYWNQGAEQLYGYTAAEAVGQDVSELLKGQDFSLETAQAILLERGTWRGEVFNHSKTGRLVMVEAHWTLVRDEAGQPKSIFVVNTDITERKKLEQQFYRAQRLESLGTLASGIAHDLNNVLTPVLTISQILQRKHPDMEARSQEMLRVMETSARRGADMIQQILTFTRGTGGDRIPSAIGPLIDDLLKVVQQTFPSSISIRATLPAEPLWIVSIDPTYMHQVLLNLCVNARDAMPDGGTLTLSAQNWVVEQEMDGAIPASKPGNYVRITVTDTGTGLTPEVRDRMFEPFFTTKPVGKGTGLGLATVLGIVKSYGGWLQVQSQVGQGTEIRIYLPASDAKAQQPEPVDGWQAGHGELILVVDDDISVQRTTQDVLESADYQTLAANNGAVARDLYRDHQAEIKLVVMDVTMPDMSGIELIQHLKAINPQVKAIAISGLLENREPMLTAGATTFLGKPFSLETFLQVVGQLIAGDGSGQPKS
jgi:PAS domain S-box-containing protein